MRKARIDVEIIRVVANNVRAGRKALGLSQEALADAAEVDRTYVSQVERRQRNLTISVLAKMAHALGTTPDKLLVPSTAISSKRDRRDRP